MASRGISVEQLLQASCGRCTTPAYMGILGPAAVQQRMQWCPAKNLPPKMNWSSVWVLLAGHSRALCWVHAVSCA